MSSPLRRRLGRGLGLWGGLLLLLGYLTFNQVTIPDDSVTTSDLPPCTADGTPFATVPFPQWKELYHSTVNTVIDAHLATSDAPATALDCTATSVQDVVRPTLALEALARQLPPWKPRGGEGFFVGTITPPLSEGNLGPVLLEFLRTYECSMIEWEHEERGLSTAFQATSSAAASSRPTALYP